MGIGDYKMAEFQGGLKADKFDDLEAGFGGSSMLYPGISADENTLRWGFIRKVYGILSVQILLTTIVAGSVVYFEGLKTFFQQTPGLVLFLAFVPLIGELPFTFHALASCVLTVFYCTDDQSSCIDCCCKSVCCCFVIIQLYSG